MKRRGIQRLIAVVFTTVLSNPMWATVPTLDYQMAIGLQSGYLSDGNVIGKGWVSYSGAHLGFRVWSEATKSGTQPNRYLLSGLHQPKNQLRVRLEQDGWQADESEGLGIITHTGDERREFRIVVDGKQSVSADMWTLPLQASALLP